MERDPGAELLWRYPQLCLAPQDNLREAAAYRDIVLRGNLPKDPQNPFAGGVDDFMRRYDTPIGPQVVFCLSNRRDFEHFVQVLCWRSAKPVPQSMGAITVFSVANWRKIEVHKREYLLAGGEDWPAEFAAFTAESTNFRDTLVVVTMGDYSGLAAGAAGYPDRTWRELSLQIRIYHELTHVVSRKLYAKNQNAVRDEILADCIGLLAATGGYEPTLAKKLLGVEGAVYRSGGRLENYLREGASPEEVGTYARFAVDELAGVYRENEGLPPFAFLQLAETERTAWPGPGEAI